MPYRPVYIRLPEDMVIELDAVADAERGDYPGREVSRVDVIREMLAKQLKERRERGTAGPNRKDVKGGPRRNA